MKSGSVSLSCSGLLFWSAPGFTDGVQISRPIFFRLVLVCAFVATWMQNLAFAWDPEGHELVATMAYARLNPKAQQAVTALACEIQSPNQPYNAVTLACWMDDLRKNDPGLTDHGLFFSWHYIDIGLDPGDPRPSFEPGDDNERRGNVVQALKRSLVVLKGGSDPYIKSKAMACAMAMHLVGDIHQPLHAATKYFMTRGELHQDSGGNKEEVSNGPAGMERFSLHQFWDSAWRASFDSVSGCVVLDQRFQDRGIHDPQAVRALAEALSKQGASQIPVGGIDIDRWALESHQLAHDFAYREITATENKKYCRLSSGYVARANALARERLVLAADRLAVLLNNTLGADVPSNPPPSYPPGPRSVEY